MPEEKKKQSLLVSFLSVSSSKFIKYGIQLIATMMLARFRTLEEYGTFSQIVLVTNLAISIFMMGLPNSLNFFLARAETDEEKNRFVSLYYTVNTVLSFIVGLLMVICTPLMEKYFHNKLLSSFLYFIAMYPWTKIILSSVENLSVVYNRTKFLAAFRLTSSLVNILIILLVQWMNWTFREYVALLLATEIIYTMVTYWFAGSNAGKLHPYFNKNLMKKILIFSIPLGLSTACGTLRHEMDKFYIGLVMDTERLAIYTNAAKEMPVKMIAASITAVLLPKMAKLQKENKVKEAVKLWHDVTVFSLILNTFFAIGLFVFSKEAILVLYSKKYLPGAEVFGIYSLTYIIRSTYFGMVLNTGGNTKLILKSSIISLVVNAVMNVVCFHLFGFVGPALATVISTFAAAFYLLYHTSKHTGIPYGKIFPWKDSGIIIAVNTVIGIGFYFLKSMIPFSSSAMEIVFALVSAVVWAGLDFVIFRKKLKEKWKIMKKH